MVKNIFEKRALILKGFIENHKNIEITENIASDLVEVFKKENKVLICGNGGSLCDAMHFAEELTGRFKKDRKPLPAISISDPSHITCVGNDYGFDYIFSRCVESYGRAGDMLFLLSTSGNSINILEAQKKAKELGIKTCGFLGKTGGSLKGKCDYEYIVKGDSSDVIQEVHMMLLHIIIELVEKELFPELY